MKEKDDLSLLRLQLRKQAQLKRLEDYVVQKTLSDEDYMIRQLPENHNKIIKRKF